MKWTICLAVFFTLASATLAEAAPDTQPASRPSIDLSSNWAMLKEGKAQGTIDLEAKYPSATQAEHLLRITETAAAPEPGEGRVGVINTESFDVQKDGYYDIRFSAVTAKASIGLVFSFESANGKVLARTTLPEIGRGANPRTAAPDKWGTSHVVLHARDTDPAARLTITPIEPTDIWLYHMTLTPRQ